MVRVKRIGIDTETWLINSEQGIVAPRMVCLTFCTEDAEVGLLTRDEALPFMHALLDADDIVFVAHHARFDMAVLAAADPTLLPKIFRAYDEGRVRCTMVREKLLALARGELADEGETGAKRNVKFSLSACVMRRFNIDLSEAKVAKGGPKPWRLRFAELDGIPVEEWPQEARDYALDDAKWNLALFDAQTTELNAEGLPGDNIPDEAQQTRGAFWLYLCSVRGVRTDPARVNRLDASLKAEYARINALVRAADVLRPKMQKGEMVWTKNMTALRERVVRAYGGEEYAPKTPKGAVSTAREDLLKPADPRVLEWIDKAEKEVLDAREADGQPEFSAEQTAALVRDLCHAAAAAFGMDGEQVYNWLVLHAVGERSGVEKLLGTYVPVLFQGTQYPITPTFNELVASGRTSSVNPNLQNPPRKGGIRECFVPRPGYWYAFCDYSFIELCTLAQSCLDMFGWSEMADAINAGLDPHLDMAASMLGVTYEEAVARKKQGDPQIGEYRQLSKALNFGFPGGLGAGKFVEYARGGYGVRLSEQEARRRKEDWYKKWPEMRLYHQHFGSLTMGDRKFTLVQPGSGRVRGEVGFCDGSNSVFQGRAADGAKRAGWYIAKECYLPDPYRDGSGPTPLYGARPVLFVHDEFILEVPVQTAHEATLRLSKVMVAGMREVVPDVKVGTEYAVATRWYKGASAAYDANGRLMPWEPKK
jgi:DNA polymerase-1